MLRAVRHAGIGRSKLPPTMVQTWSDLMLHRPGGTPDGNSVKAKTLSDFIFASTWTILHLVFKLPKLVEPVLREDMMVDICWGGIWCGERTKDWRYNTYIVPDSSSEYGFHIILYKKCFVIFTSKPVNLCTFAKHDLLWISQLCNIFCELKINISTKTFDIVCMILSLISYR